MVGRNWQPSISAENLRKRAQLLSATRAFFSARDVCEVQTPIVATAGNPDVHIDSIEVNLSAGAYDTERGYLNTSPEFCMKRLLAAGSGDIYQLCSAFRAGEAGCWHNPEFTILEWYRLGFSMQQLMDEVAALVSQLYGAELPLRFITWAEAWTHKGINPNDETALNQSLGAMQIDVPAGLSLSELQDLAFSFVVQPDLGEQGLCFVYHYPAEQASLARLSPDDDSVAERFELFWQGVELANGFVELVNAQEQRQRFQADNQQRLAAAKPKVREDERFLAALEAGLPECAGVAVGFDRLVALLLEQARLEDVITFNASRS